MKPSLTSSSKPVAPPSAAELLAGIRARINVEKQRLSRAENKLAGLRNAVVGNDVAANKEFDDVLQQVSVLRLKIEALRDEEKGALVEVEAEERRAAAAAHEQLWLNAERIGGELKGVAVEVDALLAQAGEKVAKARELARSLWVNQPEKRMHVEAREVSARLESGLALSAIKHFGNESRFRSLSALSELEIAKRTFGPAVAEAVAAFLWRDPNTKP